MYLWVSFRIQPTCDGFSINIGHDLDNIAFHFNPRLNASTIVMNHKKGYFDSGTEQHDSYFPFKQGYDFTVKFSFNQNSFNADIGGYVITFPNRFGEILYNNLHVIGDISVTNVKIDY
ncbi:beta-galactoside-binding lectin-like [Misgurnus anguillicaudatus]|uniref:beta-galactoside-binding lectin-like n=1 Tax=Misgurnus anguillicaudatus TaxID=75329 RepID=UPI003CCFA3CB